MSNDSLRVSLRASALAALGLGLLGCPPPPGQCDGGPEDPDTCPPPTLPEDICNSREEALADSRCVLTVTTPPGAVQPKEGYLTTLADGGIDRDWYSVQLGALTPRSLVHINGGYTAPSTAVNFSLNVLLEDGRTSPTCTGADAGAPSCATSGVDRHTAAAPRPVDLVLPFGEPNRRFVILVSDEGGSAQVRVDNRNPYRIFAEVLENPDANEPNDVNPTEIPLPPSGGMWQGSRTGFLATNDDIDRYRFEVTQTGRHIIYLHLTMATLPSPPPPFRLAYELYDPNGTRIAEDFMINEFTRVDLATAKLAPRTGFYTLVVQGYHDPNTPGIVVRGDPRRESEYTVEVKVMPDLDTTEGSAVTGNDTFATARPVGLTLDVPAAPIVGKLAHIPDEEWFALDLSPSPTATAVLRYSLSASTSGGRFAPTSLLPNRQIRLLTEVNVPGTTQDKQRACRDDRTVCPKGEDDEARLDLFRPLVVDICNASSPTQCLWAERNEEPNFAALRNFNGSIPIAPHGSTTRVYLMVRDVGRGRQKYADDRDWTLRLSYQSNPPDDPLNATMGTTNGWVAYGFGRTIQPWFDLTRSPGIRGPNDYDAKPTDLDTYSFALPSAVDQAWSISWDLLHPDAGQPAGELTVEVSFCEGASLPDGGCGGARKVLAYQDEPSAPWYLPQNFSNATTLFSKSTSGGTTTVSVLPVACPCIPAVTAATGRIVLRVGAANRMSSDPIRYRLNQSVSPYPQSYTPPDGGGSRLCPVPDGGCGFGR